MTTQLDAPTPDSRRGLQHHQDDGKPVSLKRLLVGTVAIPVAAFGLMMAFAVDANATPQDYAISPTVFSFSGGATTETLSGVFSISGSTLLSVDLTLSGDGLFTAGAYVLPISVDSQAIGAATTTGYSALEVVFTGSLAGQIDPIYSLEVGEGCIGVSCFFHADTFSFPSGASADPIPEPSSIAILGAAFGLFGLGRRTIRR